MRHTLEMRCHFIPVKNNESLSRMNIYFNRHHEGPYVISQQTLVPESLIFQELLLNYHLIWDCVNSPFILHVGYVPCPTVAVEFIFVYLKVGMISITWEVLNKYVFFILFWNEKMSITFTFLFVRTNLFCWMEILPIPCKLNSSFSACIYKRKTEENERERSWSRENSKLLAFYIW